jgi:hypothetical protein
MRLRIALVLLPLVLGLATPTWAATPGSRLVIERAAQADRLAKLGAEAIAAHLGTTARRLYEEALALAPDHAGARLALGWTQDGDTWIPPDDAVPPPGWADDGETNLGKFAKREAEVRLEYVKALVAAASVAKPATPEVADELLWAAIAADPTDPAPRRALGHAEVEGRYVAPEHAAILAAGLGPTQADRTAANEPTDAHPIHSKVDRLLGRTQPIPEGFRSRSAGQVHSLSPGVDAAEGARLLERARIWLDATFGNAPRGDPYTIVVVLGTGVARHLLTANELDGKVDQLGVRSAIPMGKLPLLLVSGESETALFDALVATRVESDVAARDVKRGARWLGRAVGVVASLRLLGATTGFAASAGRPAGSKGPTRRPEEPLLAFARRLAATASDTPLPTIASDDDRLAPPCDLLVTALVLDFLLRRDPASGRQFVTTYLFTSGTPEVRLETAATAAGFASLDALSRAWRRFACDVYPAEVARGPSGAAWKIAPLAPPKTRSTAASLYAPLRRRVTDQVTLGGRSFLLADADYGKGVRAQGYRATDPLRVVTKASTLPFPMEREYGGGRVDAKLELAPGGPAWTYRRAESFAGLLDGVPVEVLDLDVDGRFGGFERDGLVLDKGRFALPLPRQLALGARVVEIRRVGPDGKEIAWRVFPSDAKGPDLEAWLALNSLRAACGVPPLVFDAGLAAGCAAHASYVATNLGLEAGPDDVLREDASKPDATREGAGVAARCLAADEATPSAAVARWLASPRPLAALLDPTARRGALGAAKGVVVFTSVARSDLDAEPFRGPLVYPFDGAPAFAGAAGQDLVRSENRLTAAGRPILVWMAPGRGEVKDVEVVPADGSGSRLELLRWDGLAWGRPGLVAFAPSAPLARDVAYRLRATLALDGEDLVVERTLPASSAGK